VCSSDLQTLDVVTMVYAGLINKRTVAALQARGCNAIGLTGADAGLIIANKRPVMDIDYGFVGDVESVNSNMLKQILELGLIPIVAPLTFDIDGSMLNTNADTIASEVAISMATIYEVRLIYCFEKAGVLSNTTDDKSIIETINLNSYANLKTKGIITDGMIPKLDNCLNALRKGIKEVWITNAKAVNSKQGTKLTI
jgi:acetylglutamate kinase